MEWGSGSVEARYEGSLGRITEGCQLIVAEAIALVLSEIAIE